MDGPAVIGVDVGTTSTKAGAYRLDGSACATAQVATRLLRRGAGEVEQDPRELLDAACEAIAACVAQAGLAPGEVAALAVSGQMAGVLGVDADWQPVTPYDSWLDARCTPQLRRLAAEHGELVVERTGCPPMLDHAPKLQWWRDERPADYARVAAWLMPAAYVAGSLAGLTAADAFIDPTYLHFTGLADARTGAWSDELLAALALERAQLPSIVAPDAVIGELSAAAAARCGLRAGIPIAAGMGDTAAGALGAGIVAPGQLLDTAGTASVLIGAVERFAPDHRQGLIVMRGVLADQWLPLNYVAGGGLCLPWLAEQTGVPLPQLLAEAERVPPGSDGLLFVPHLEGRTAPFAPEMRGGWVGLGLAHTRGHLARAILESIAFEYATYMRAMQRLHPQTAFTSVRAIGGGARSAGWNQIKADVLGLPVDRVTVEETATRGAALLAAAAVGLIALGDVAGSAPTTPSAAPDAARHAAYAEAVDRYAAAVEALAPPTAPASPAPNPTTTPERHLVS
ncbi:MAG: hypothetical protein JWQ48_3536 [Conexibacter sp.]|nr:hypothetical protein [Conexibacter sp.]